RKRFNWLSLFDEIFIGFIAGTFLSTLAIMHDPSPVFALDWGMIALIVGGAVAAAIVLETLRKWNPVQESAIPEDTASIEREIGGLTEEGKPWDYQDTQNPAYMNWVVIGTGLVGILAAVSIWPQSPWLSVLIFVLAALPVVFYGGLRVSVTPERVRVRLGFLGIPLLTLKIIDLADVQVHQFSPLADFGGYGIRFNAQIKAYFLRGNRGVKLTTVRGKNYLIGSDRPERLSAVIQIAKRLAG
ncbi:hypothetical protein LLG39_04815, partial [bacterium]|nr:hypothetical protein [bacterium]